jgi:transposase InsO family protein
VLQDKAEDIFQEWAESSLEYPSVKITPSEHNAKDIDLACLYSLDTMMNGAQKRTDSTEIPVYNQDLNFNLNDQSAMSSRERRLRKRQQIIREALMQTENVSQEQDSTVGQDSTTTVPTEQDGSRQDTTEGQGSDITVTTADKEQCIRTTPHPLHVISTSLPPDPIETWPAKQTLDDIPSGMARVPQDKIKRGLPRSLIVLKDDKGRERILVPRCQRQRLVIKEHETMLHQSGARVNYELSRKYIWPNMVREIKSICKACHICQLSKVRRQNLSADFEQADKDDIPLPRQAYGIDFYGHAKGEILVAIDLCTREVMLWFLHDRKMEGVTRALLSGLIFQKGVPLLFVNDEAKEFVDGTVHAMNQYLGIEQVTTGGHNPRSNAIVERFMQHLTGCLTKCDDTQYKNIRDYLPAIAFAHNSAFNSVINCSPFEAPRVESPNHNRS